MFEFLLVRVSVWLACVAWFAGAFCRLLSAQQGQTPADLRREQQSVEAAYGWLWLVGSLLLCIHIAASYGFVHHWSHRDAVEVTARESFRVTGISAGWGVYVNFLFALVWLGYSIALVATRRRDKVIDRSVYVFLAIIFGFATVVFEAGVIRYAALAAFLALVVLHVRIKSAGAPV
ncbi:hypothetical protein CKO51_20870 [Rhodopirellula sp. SM50]|nr:hypothetical protein [Rhodopirellula sp. SM50]PAY17519.1 hypothetical protein CKO51_20870 [Rhodopirellula sp. SM50]